ncbi:MAG: nuclear transport factor 2 family protein [Rhizobiales bacterium]|nr:nuclear transport factor 2 family protein [Hyphomicrobiales bacterium]
MNLTRRKLAYAGGLMAGAALIGATSAVPALACADDDLAKAVEDFRKAMVEANGARLLELSADEMSFGHANGVIQTKIEFVKSVVDKAEVFKRIDLVSHQNRVAGDIGIARHTFDADIFFQGKDISLTLGIVMVWKNVDGRFRLFARQSFKPITV